MDDLPAEYDDTERKIYTGVDIWKFIFACLIPILHIQLPGVMTPIIQQYFSRIGVPFFFAVSGFFLSKNLECIDRFSVMKKFLMRVGKMLLIWFVIYLPLFIFTGIPLGIKNTLFLTSAYLWYLTAVFISAIPFCLMKKRRLLYLCAGILYVVGTFLSTYKFICVWGEQAYMKSSSLQLEMV